MSSHASAARPLVLADLVAAGSRTRDIALVVAGAGFVALSAQVSIPLPFTAVPLTLQTFAVLLTGAALGWQRAVPSMLLYLLAGAAGLPWFADGESGTGSPTFGYIVGFVLAAAVVGRLAGSGADRTPLRTFALMALGSALIYLVGVPWLAVALDLSLAEALADGLIPFLGGDAVKALAAAGLLPGAWRLVGDRTR